MTTLPPVGNCMKTTKAIKTTVFISTNNSKDREILTKMKTISQVVISPTRVDDDPDVTVVNVVPL